MINQRIRDLRKALSLSQVKFAEGISISNGYIAALELGKRQVNERMIKLICSAYGVSERWLRNGEGEMFPQASEQKTEKIIALFKELNPQFQDYVLKQIDDLLDLQKQGRPNKM